MKLTRAMPLPWLPRFTYVTVVILLVSFTCLTTAGNQDDQHDHSNHDHHDDHDHANDVADDVADDVAGDVAGDASGDALTPEELEAKLYMKEIFEKYGDDGIITFEGFEHLLLNLGLGGINIADHDIHDHYSEHGDFTEFHPDHDHSNDTDSNHDNHVHGDDDHHSSDNHDHDNEHGNRGSEEGSHGDEAQSRDYGDGQKSQHHNDGQHHHDHHDDNSHDVHHDVTVDVRNSSDVHGDSNRTKVFADKGETRAIHGATEDSSVSPSNHTLTYEESVGNVTEAGHNVTRHSHVSRRKARAVSPSDHVNHGHTEKKCLTADEILANFFVPMEAGIKKSDFLLLCPAIIHQIDEHACARKQPCPGGFHDDKGWHCDGYHGDENKDLRNHEHGEHDHHGNDTEVQRVSLAENFWDIPGKVWGFAMLSVVIISLVGLFCVALIPIMNKVFYNHLLQFLVALAIGTLTGDALLHLLPHSMEGPHTEKEDDHGHGDGDEGDGHRNGIYKGLVVLSGIYAFFIMERLLAMATSLKRNKRKRMKGDPPSPQKKGREEIGQKLSNHNDTYASCGDFMSVHPSKDISKMADDAHEELKELKSGESDCHDDQCGDHGDETGKHSHGGHGGHGGHGHSHGKVPESVSAIAWMVIMGDGLHNFTDGLAIGASFSNSLSAGVSTTIAVFCHELPHELGDFAVLLRAGMSVKQALIYNILSSVLCILGMVIGVFLGNFSSASQWIFAMTAGIFIYISLVDMLPEITTTQSPTGRAQCGHLFLHCLGITLGVSIMLIIALFEDRIALQLGDEVV